MVKTWSRADARAFDDGLLVLVCGSRSWHDDETMRYRLRDLPPASVIVHGAARGADAMAAQIARSLGIVERGYPADWRTFGKRAGVLRNLALLEMEPNLVIAFWDGRSTGTRHVILEAAKRHIPTEVIREALG